MGFLQIKKDSFYLQIDANPRPIRPLLKEAMGKWIHQVPSCSVNLPTGATQVIRYFKMIDADFSQWMKNNPDPLWDQLEKDNKFNRQNQRQDFAMRPLHILPVWSYADNDVRIVKQGNQFFEEMVKYYDQGGDVTSCDWICWTEGQGRNTKYKTSRQDSSPFNCPIDPNTIGQKIQAMMDQALTELRPFKTEQDLLTYIHGQMSTGATTAQIPQTVGTPMGMPSYIPGGQPPMLHGMTPIPQQASVAPTYQQQPQMPTYPPQQTAQPQAPSYPPQQAIVHNDIPNAPVSTAPVFAPPVQANAQRYQPPQSVQPQAPVYAPPQQPAQAYVSPQQPQQVMSGPAGRTLDFGKHSGRTLGWIKENDPSYLSFLKGNKPELKSDIEALLGESSPGQQRLAPTDAEEERSQLVKEINEKIMTIPEFQGIGLHQAMLPFLQNTIGTANFTDAPLDKLQVLKQAVDQKMAHG